MWISIRAKRTSLSPRMRRNVEKFVRRALQREQRHIASAVVQLAPAKLGGEAAFSCQITLWSHHLGIITVNQVGDTVRTAVQQARWRARQIARRRLHKRRSQARRIGRGRLSRWLPEFGALPSP